MILVLQIGPKCRQGGRGQNPKNLVDVICNETGLEVMERLHFLASLPLAGTAQTEGGGDGLHRYMAPNTSSQMLCFTK